LSKLKAFNPAQKSILTLKISAVITAEKKIFFYYNNKNNDRYRLIKELKKIYPKLA
jgi:hypothetical protein